MAIYGDMLAYFPELMQNYVPFMMKPLAGGGFAPREEQKKVRGYFTKNLGGDAGSPDQNFNEFDKAKLFAYSRVPADQIRQGLYIEVDGDLYKFVQQNNYTREGGFIEYKLLLTTGPTDQQVTNPAVAANVLNGY